MRSFFHALVEACSQKESFVLGLISGVQGSSPQKRGAKALFFPDGRIVGTLGGGCLEAEVRRRALEALKAGQAEKFDLLLDHDFGWDDGLICGGKVYGLIVPGAARYIEIWKELVRRERTLTWGIDEDFDVQWMEPSDSRPWLYQETVSPPFALWIAGSGHIARAVAPLAQQLDFEVTVFDDRPALASRQFYPAETLLRVDYWPNLLNEPLPSRPTFGLIVTRGHQHDALVLKGWIQKPFAFLGMIGSKRKKRIIFSHFAEEGIATEEQLSRVACPVGIDIDAVSVEEIAVSIVAQLVQKRADLLGSAKRAAASPLEFEECTMPRGVESV
jgi:xanthine dehydrogenase accessory factor